MLIKKLIETEDGAVEFNANLDPKEVTFLIEFAINYLMGQGAIPFSMKDRSEINPPTESLN